MPLKPKAMPSSGVLAGLTEKNIPPKELADYAILLFGEKGIGKTSLLSQFKDSLVFMFEPRRRNLEITQVWQNKDKTGPLDWATFEEAAAELIELGPESSGYRTLAIDSLDRAYKRCLEAVCRESGFEHPNDANDFGKTWEKIKERFEGTLVRLGHAGYGICLTSHGKVHRMQPPLGDAYDQQGITASGSAKDVADVICDFVVYYGYHGNNRTFTVRGNQAVYASCGVENRFLDPDGNKLQTFDAGSSPEEAFKSLHDGFNNLKRGIIWKPPESVLESFEYKEALPDIPDTTKKKGIVKKVTAKSE
jgi:GTPase SAR1 family protein